MNHNIFLKFFIEIILLLIAVSTNLLKDLLNPDLVKVIEKNKVYKYIILFLLAHISSSFYLKESNSDKFNPINYVWSLGIVFGFYLLNKLHYKIIIGFISFFILMYASFKIINFYK